MNVLLAPARLLAALVTSVLVGVLAAAVAFPVVAGAGLAAKESADDYLVLPADLQAPDLARRTRILAQDGSLITYLYSENRIPVAFEDIPQSARDAVVAIEDSRFYEHEGIDPKGMVRAAITNARSGAVQQGASTLTQQYVKNARIAAATTPEQVREAREVSVTRKLQEARYALALERKLSKDEILQSYMNIAYYGNGAYGIGAAAAYYFGKPVQDLALHESALLAGIVQNPTRHDPVDRPRDAQFRRDVVLNRMAELGGLSQEELAAALAQPLGLNLSPVASGCEAPGVAAPFFCDYVRRALETTPLGAALGDTLEERQQRLFNGGLTIRTTLHPGMQSIAQTVLDTEVPRDDPSGVAAVYTAVDPGTGEVRVMAVDRVYAEEGPGRTKVNLALGGSSGMQAGSTFKPFVLAAALQQGMPLNTTFPSPASYTSDVFVNCDGRTCDEPYTVNNAGDSNAGVHDLVSGTRNSVNTFYLQLLEKTGVEQPAALAEAFGLRQFQDGAATAPLHRGGSFVLGVNEVSPLALSAAYATFAARGTYCPPRPVVEVLERDGTPLPLPPQECRQVLEPQIADTVSSVLRGVVDGPWSRTARRASIGRPVAGKTGSTNGSKAAWFAGYTPQVAATVWIGKPVPVELRQITIGGDYYPQVYGGTLPAQLWAQITGPLLTGVPVADLPPPAFSNPQRVKRERGRGGDRDRDGRGGDDD